MSSLSRGSRTRQKTRLCTSIAADTPEELGIKATRALSLGSDLVELRIDRLAGGAAARDVERLVEARARRTILTVRSSKEGGGFMGSEEARLAMISRLCEARPAYVDIELAAAKAEPAWAGSLSKGVRRIVSWHDFQGTPSPKVLREVCREALRYGEIAKVVTTARSEEDNLAALGICASRPGKVVSFCMGSIGMVSRVVSMSLGAPIAYASLPDEGLAPGQLSITTMRTLRRMVG